MTIEEAVRERILDLNTNAGARVYMLIIPQNLRTWPAVRVQLIDAPTMQHLRGPNYPITSRIQVDYYAGVASGVDPYASVSTLAQQVRGDGLGPNATGLFGWTGEVGG